MIDVRHVIDRRMLVAAAVLAIVVVLAILAPWFSTGDPLIQGDVVATRFLAPFTTDPAGQFHLLGTDRFGRDVWTRLLYGRSEERRVGKACRSPWSPYH